MKQVIIYPGRFQPMLSHHAEVYSQLQSQFPEADVYIGTSDKVEADKSPFTFKEKQLIAQAHGIDPSKILQAKRPYHKDDYPFDEDNTVIIFAVGEKDMDRFPFNNVDPDTELDMTVRGEPKPKYYQKINTYRTDPKPMAERGYITLAPTISIGDEVASASAFRDALKNAPDKESAEQVYTKQFGNFDPKIFELIYGKITGQNNMNEELNKIRKLAGMPPLTESFDPAMEPSQHEEAYNGLMNALQSGGEEELAKAMGLSIEELDQEINEYGMEHGLHADDDRDDIIQGVIEQMIDNMDVKEGGGTPDLDEVAGAKDCWDGYKKDGTQPGTGKNKGKRVNKCVKEDEENTIQVNKTIQLRGDSIWDEDGKNPESVNITTITITKDEDDDNGYAHISVEHDGPWTVYTDSGFEAEVSKIVGFVVSFTEQGMQEEGEASLEGNTSDKGQTEDLDRMRHLAGLDEAPMPDFDKGERPKNSKERAAYRKWKKSNAAGKKDDDAPLTISPKDRKDAEARPEKAAAADPAKAQFTDITLKGMKVDGKSIPSSQRAKSIANQFPEGSDLNDPAVKKEVFLKFTAKRPDLMLGEINARITNDEEGLAISDRLSPIVRQLEDSRNIMELEPEDKSFALKILNNAINNMDLVKAAEIDKQIEVEPMQLDTDDDDEREYDDDAMVPVLDPGEDEEFVADSLDLSSIRDEFGVNEGRMKDIIQDAMDMDKEEFDAQYKGEYDWDSLQKEYADESVIAEKCAQCGMEDCPCEPGECDCDPVEEGADGRDPVTGEISPDWKDANSMSREQFIQKYGAHAGARWDDVNGNTPEKRKANFATMSTADRAAAMRGESIEEIVDEAVENTIDIAISELKQLAGI